MSAFTYDQLVSALQSWPEDSASEYLAAIPRLISLAETALIVDLNLDIFDLTKTDIVITGGNRLVPKPDDLIVARSLHSIIDGEWTPLLLRSKDWCDNFAPNPSVVGLPRYYCEYSQDFWQIVATPNQTCTAASHYVSRPAGLSSTNQSTWLSKYVGDLLFVLALKEAEQWTKADDRYADMMTKYQQELLPTRRLELRNMIRGGDYSPMRPVAQKAG